MLLVKVILYGRAFSTLLVLSWIICTDIPACVSYKYQVNPLHLSGERPMPVHISGFQDFYSMLSYLDFPSSRCHSVKRRLLISRLLFCLFCSARWFFTRSSHEEGLCFVLVVYLPKAVPRASWNISIFSEADPSSLGSAMWTSLSFYFPWSGSLHDPCCPVKFLFALKVVPWTTPLAPLTSLLCSNFLFVGSRKLLGTLWR